MCEDELLEGRGDMMGFIKKQIGRGKHTVEGGKLLYVEGRGRYK